MDASSDSPLLDRIAKGDATAVPLLLRRYRDRLRRMVQYRLDPRVAARIDASDVVQEALLTATGTIRDYAQQRPVAFYPWLRRIAWERMIDLQRQHLDAQRRSVLREAQMPGSFSDASLYQLVAPPRVGRTDAQSGFAQTGSTRTFGLRLGTARTPPARSDLAALPRTTEPRRYGCRPEHHSRRRQDAATGAIRRLRELLEA